MKKIIFLVAMLVIGMISYAAEKRFKNEQILIPNFNKHYLILNNTNLINSLNKVNIFECRVEIQLSVSIRIPGTKTGGSVSITISAECKDIISAMKAAADAVRATAEEESNISNDNLCVISIQNYTFI